MAYQEVLMALADPTRRQILECLLGQERMVAAIAAAQTVSRPAVSQHLKVLQDAGLVQARTHGTRRFYSIRREGLESLRTYLEGFWSDVLHAYADEVEKHVGSK